MAIKKISIADLAKKVKDKQKSKGDGGSFTNDFWRPTIEKGQERVEYIIRFLPNPDSIDGVPNVDRYSHMVNFPNGKYLSVPCAKKSGKDDNCYICEDTAKGFKSDIVSQQNLAKARYAKARYFYNILVIRDPREDGKHEGKIYMFEAGKQIQDKCSEFVVNEEIREEDRNFYDPLVGTNFKLVVTIKSEYSNYDKTDFMRSTSAIEFNGKKITSEEEGDEFVEKNCFKLNEVLFKDKLFKSYDEIKELYLNQGEVKSAGSKKPSFKKEEEIDEEEEDRTVKNKKIEVRNPPKPKKVEPEEEPEDEDEDSATGTDDDEDEELARLLDGD